ncbi:MAG: protein translocase subunit SecF [Acidobacteriota bacterium]|nr:protein translocase subunit SecF [Acidobacteriota bacterium]
MIRLLHNVKIDWLSKRRIFLFFSAVLLLAGLASAVVRYALPGLEPFNLGVDFKGGTLLTVRFSQSSSEDAIRAALAQKGIRDAVVQSAGKPNEFLVKVPLQGTAESNSAEAQVDPGQTLAAEALGTFGAVGKISEGGAVEIIGTDAVGAVAGPALRNRAVAVTLLALVGMLLYIAYRFEWAYGAAAVITVIHDVLVTLGFFSIFQWEINLTVVAAFLTLVGFSMNDTIVTFDRVRENLRLRRRETLYNITNEAINQTLSRTIITGGLVLFSVLGLVVFGGEVLHSFSLALFVGIIVGTYSTIAIASPIMVWWQQRLEAKNKPLPIGARGNTATAAAPKTTARNAKASAAARGSR